MKILALDTAAERCSVALVIGERVIERSQDTQRGHAERILPMVQEVLEEGGLELQALDGIAYGRGPGAFTGVRIAVGVVQGLAFGATKPTVGVSDLAAVAQQAASADDAEILVCMDARMGEVYWARFRTNPATGLVEPVSAERVDRPEAVEPGDASVFAGTGFRAHPQLAAGGARVYDALLPRAREIALLAAPELAAGRGRPAAEAAPVYVRDNVAVAK